MWTWARRTRRDPQSDRTLLSRDRWYAGMGVGVPSAAGLKAAIALLLALKPSIADREPTSQCRFSSRAAILRFGLATEIRVLPAQLQLS